MIKIGIVIPEGTGDFQRDAEIIAESMQIIPVFCTGHFAGVIPEARRIIHDNPDLLGFIARSTTANYLRKSFDLPVVGIEMSNFDFCNTIAMLPDRTGNFIVVQYSNSPSAYDVDSIARICGITLKTIFLDSDAECDVAEAVKAAGGTRVVSSVAVVTEPCRRAGLEVIPLRFSRQVIVNAMHQMLNIIDAKQKEQQRTEQLLHIMNTLSTGVMAVDKRGKIVTANKALCDLIEYPYPSLIGTSLKEIAEEVPLIRMLAERQEEGVIEYRNNKYTVALPEFLKNDMVYNLWMVRSFSNLQEKAVYFRRKLTENSYKARYHFSDIVSISPAMEQIKERARQYAHTDCNILILGESGTGKEMLAQSIHNESEFRDGPFIAINCAALPENLLESELFGYEDGAFTGAKKGGKEGLIELSNQGTLFLDEIGCMPLSLQVKLLRSLQERQIRRVGGTKVIPIENRIISATNNSLIDDIREGRFRDDLFWRLDVLHIYVPPLRERTGDIPFLVNTMLHRKNALRQRSLEIDNSLMNYLTKYNWPGNFRQLESFVERLFALSRGQQVEENTLRMLLKELPSEKIYGENAGDWLEDNEDQNYYKVHGNLVQAEEQIIREVYSRCHGDIASMMKVLDISRTTLWRKLKKLDLM